MNVKKFSGSSSRQALQKLREAMGPDAVILSTRNVNGQIEILALAEEDITHLTEPTQVRARLNTAEDEVRYAPSSEAKAETEPDHFNNAAFNPKTNPILHSQALFAMKKKQSDEVNEMSIDLSE